MHRILVGALGLAMTWQSVHACDAPAFQVGQKWSIKNSGIEIVIGRKGGIFTIPVSQLPEVTFKTLQQGKMK